MCVSLFVFIWCLCMPFFIWIPFAPFLHSIWRFPSFLFHLMHFKWIYTFREWWQHKTIIDTMTALKLSHSPHHSNWHFIIVRCHSNEENCVFSLVYFDRVFCMCIVLAISDHIGVVEAFLYVTRCHWRCWIRSFSRSLIFSTVCIPSDWWFWWWSDYERNEKKKK